MPLMTKNRSVIILWFSHHFAGTSWLRILIYVLLTRLTSKQKSVACGLRHNECAQMCLIKDRILLILPRFVKREGRSCSIFEGYSLSVPSNWVSLQSVSGGCWQISFIPLWYPSTLHQPSFPFSQWLLARLNIINKTESKVTLSTYQSSELRPRPSLPVQFVSVWHGLQPFPVSSPSCQTRELMGHW